METDYQNKFDEEANALIDNIRNAGKMAKSFAKQAERSRDLINKKLGGNLEQQIKQQGQQIDRGISESEIKIKRLRGGEKVFGTKGLAHEEGELQKLIGQKKQFEIELSKLRAVAKIADNINKSKGDEAGARQGVSDINNLMNQWGQK